MNYSLSPTKVNIHTMMWHSRFEPSALNVIFRFITHYQPSPYALNQRATPRPPGNSSQFPDSAHTAFSALSPHSTFYHTWIKLWE